MHSLRRGYRGRLLISGRLISIALAGVFAPASGLAGYRYLTKQTSSGVLIEQGLRRNEFLPYYQPIVDSLDGSVVGAEALVRWKTKGGKLIPPVQFIPFAEDNLLIEPHYGSTFGKVLDDIKRFGWQGTDRFRRWSCIGRDGQNALWIPCFPSTVLFAVYIVRYLSCRLSNMLSRRQT